MFRREHSSSNATNNKSRPSSQSHNNGSSYHSPSQSASKIQQPFGEKHVDSNTPAKKHHGLPFHHGKKKTKGIKPDGESGRSWFHPWKFCRICFRSSSRLSMATNVLWPIVPAAIAVHFVYSGTDEHHLLIFILNYIAMVPAANLIGFAGQELARKLPKVFGIILETTLGSVVELILFIVLVVFGSNGRLPTGYNVVKAAILGSILANLLLALGACFIAGGFQRDEQEFHEVVSEVGSGLLLVAGVGLIAPTVFATIAGGATELNAQGFLRDAEFERRVLDVSRAAAICLLISYAIYLIFQTTSHHSIWDEVLEADEQRDEDRHKDLAKDKLTFTECVIALLIGMTCVSLVAVFLVLEIDPIIEDHGVSEAFMGLILVPLVEKAAEHLTAVDEAYDNQANFALAHVLGSSLQTALLNAPIAIIVGWGLNGSFDLNFHHFEAIMLILSIIVVGNFLRDKKSNYLEGALCVIVYVIIAVCAFYYPDESPEEPAAEPAATEAAMHLIRSAMG